DLDELERHHVPCLDLHLPDPVDMGVRLALARCDPADAQPHLRRRHLSRELPGVAAEPAARGEARREDSQVLCAGEAQLLAVLDHFHRNHVVSSRRRVGEVFCAGIRPSSTALICSARTFEYMRHWAKLPAVNHSPGWPVRVHMLRSSCASSSYPQTGPTRPATASPRSLRTRTSRPRQPVARTMGSAGIILPRRTFAPP